METKRLMIAAYNLSDAPGLFTLIQDNRQVLSTMGFSQTSKVSTLAEAQAYIAKFAHKRSAQTDFCYALKAGDKQIGQLQIKGVDVETGGAELAYFIDINSRRQGFAKEAIETVTRQLLERAGLIRVFVRTLRSNVAAIALAENLGFENQGFQLERAGQVALYAREGNRR
jgi:RimJ/RimL family protein N-acetyltransferase